MERVADIYRQCPYIIQNMNRSEYSMVDGSPHFIIITNHNSQGIRELMWLRSMTQHDNRERSMDKILVHIRVEDTPDHRFTT